MQSKTGWQEMRLAAYVIVEASSLREWSTPPAHAQVAIEDKLAGNMHKGYWKKLY